MELPDDWTFNAPATFSDPPLNAALPLRFRLLPEFTATEPSVTLALDRVMPPAPAASNSPDPEMAEAP